MDDKNKLALSEKKNIVFDVDGVFADMDGSYDKYIKHIIPDYSEEKYITDWGMPVVAKNYPEAFKIVQSLWVSADFIGKLNRFPKVVEGLKELDKSITLCRTRAENAAKAKVKPKKNLKKMTCPKKTRKKWVRAGEKIPRS